MIWDVLLVCNIMPCRYWKQVITLLLWGESQSIKQSQVKIGARRFCFISSRHSSLSSSVSPPRSFLLYMMILFPQLHGRRFDSSLARPCQMEESFDRPSLYGSQGENSQNARLVVLLCLADCQFNVVASTRLVCPSGTRHAPSMRRFGIGTKSTRHSLVVFGYRVLSRVVSSSSY